MGGVNVEFHVHSSIERCANPIHRKVGHRGHH